MRGRRLAQIALAAGMLVVLWHLADGAGAARRLVHAEAGWLFAAAVVLMVQTALSGLRWRLTAAQLGITISRAEALREYWLAQAINQTLPGGVLGDAGRALRQRGQAGLMASGQAVVLERLAGQAGLLAVLLAGMGLTWALPGGLDWPGGSGWLLLAGVGAAGAGTAALARAPGRQAVALRRALAAPGVWPAQMAFSLGTALCNVAAFGFCAWAVGAALPVAALGAVVPLILFAMVVPVTISGWGLREGAAAALFPLAGLSAAEGLAASVAFGLVLLATALPGVVVLVMGRTAPVPKP